LDLVIFAETTFVKQLRWLPAGVAQNFTGWTARLRVGTPGQPALVQLTTENGGLTLTTDGLITITITSTITAALASATYQLDLIDPAGAATRFLRGSCTVVRDVEAPTTP
jgi:hypothetical protein